MSSWFEPRVSIAATVADITLDCLSRLSEAGGEVVKVLADRIMEDGRPATGVEQAVIAEFVRVQADVATRLQELRG